MNRQRCPPCVVVIALACTLVPKGSAAQTPPADAPVANAPLVVSGQRIRVTTRDGGVAPLLTHGAIGGHAVIRW